MPVLDLFISHARSYEAAEQDLICLLLILYVVRELLVIYGHVDGNVALQAFFL